MAGTVFFGPFIGELGWELLFWQGWVRKLCRGDFHAYRKIAASFPGRQPFYPYVDEFWPLPPQFVRLGTSAHAYYTDGWRGGYPGTQVATFTVRSVVTDLLRGRRPRRTWLDRPLPGPDVEPHAQAVLDEMTRHLPEDAVCFVPWKPNQYAPDGLEFGVHIPPGGRPTSKAPVVSRIGFAHQILEHVAPTAAAVRDMDVLVPAGGEGIAVFPRRRLIRRPEKNWPREKYEELVHGLRARYPGAPILILGEPGGAHFADGVPAGTLDFINLPSDRRLDLQLAALGRCRLALGSMSGALLVALAAGCPALIWGFASSQARYHAENFMGTPMIYHADIDPPVERILELVQALERMTRTSTGRAGDRPQREAIRS